MEKKNGMSERLCKLETQILDIENTIKEIKNSIIPEKEVFDIDHLEKEASSNCFDYHIIQELDEEVAYKYAVYLSVIAEKTSDLSVRIKQYYHLLRVYHTAKGRHNIGNSLLRDSKISTIEDIAQLGEMKEDVLTSFFVDALLMVFASAVSDEQLDLICELFAFCGLKKDCVRDIKRITSAIIMQNEEELLDISKECNINAFYCYFGKKPDYFVLDSIGNASNFKGRNILVYKNKVCDRNEVFDIDSLGKNLIIFKKCEFDNIVGIKCHTTKVIFEECLFTNCVQRNELSSSLEKRKYENGNPKTLFMDCKGVELTDCKFINCSLLGVGQKSSVFSFSESTLNRCHFSNCNIAISTHSDPEGQVLLLQNSGMDDCEFVDCSSYGEVEYGRFDSFHMKIVTAIGGHVCNCNFHKCTADSQNVSYGTKDNFILLFNDRCKEYENDFSECTAYQTSNYGNNRMYELKISRKID